MRRGLLFGVLLLLAGTAAGQQLPRFEAFPVQEAPYHGPHAAPKLKPGTAAWQFRTRIRAAATTSPNFAGHYVLAAWGCGAECLSYAIIDVTTGAVWFEDQTVCCWYGTDGTTAPNETFEPIAVRVTSRLVVLTGLLNEEGKKAPHYFQLRHGRLVPVGR